MPPSARKRLRSARRPVDGRKQSPRPLGRGNATLYRRSDFKRQVPVEHGEGGAASWRTEFARDLARIIHSPSFRRLQGKTQLFPGAESDFFRNRLTHSIEVGQIARAIGRRANATLLRRHGSEVDLDLLELAGLAHDIGHPPFGHTGEEALNFEMKEFGGFESNAQSLRVLARIEKKLDAPSRQLDEDREPIWARDGQEVAVGLNLCARTLASVLKYDSRIDYLGDGDKPRSLQKGYFPSESRLVQQIKRHVSGDAQTTPFKSVECQIMDIADDIAYSTYDLEDAFKAKLLAPLDLLTTSDEILKRTAERATRELGIDVSPADVHNSFAAVFEFFGHTSAEGKRRRMRREVQIEYNTSSKYASNGYLRSYFSGELVNQFIRGVSVEFDDERPWASKVKIDAGLRLAISVLKQSTYVRLIGSDRMLLIQERSRRIIKEVFQTLAHDDGHRLLPPDWRGRFNQAEGSGKQRVVCDFIASMTDRHAVDFYARLTSKDFSSMFRVF